MCHKEAEEIAQSLKCKSAFVWLSILVLVLSLPENVPQKIGVGY